ncbi:MAG TPA: UDP-N-acetylmuramate--L-alanine ligase [Verrucomicrobiae bacterium]|nr:UDP-N-acetylmuramate--L-alanine ligase [Verrucomicrobiae bacterium]
MTFHIHFVGIKGTGMSALAQITANLENTVITGSDVSERFFTDTLLEQAGINVLPFSPANVTGADLVVVSAAYGQDHPEIARAQELNIPVLTYPQYLGRLMSERRGVCITGTHGKTTTTAMVGATLIDANFAPTVVVGSNVHILGGNAFVGSGEFFVAESCEYRRHFLNYRPEFLVILNMELDHPDYFKDLNDVVSAFQELAEKVPSHGKVIIWGDDPVRSNISSKAEVITYGLSESNDFRAVNVHFNAGKSSFEVLHNNTCLGTFTLGVMGNHNVLNALATIALTTTLGVPIEQIKASLAKFSGTKRRFEQLGQYNGALIMDDYAHHPTEVNTTLEGAHLAYPDRKIIAVFQPHTFTRTEKLLDQFARSFTHADEVIVTNIFASAREKTSKTGISSELLAEQIREQGKEVRFFPDFAAITAYLSDSINEKSLVITMGAGDIYKVGVGLVELGKK